MLASSSALLLLLLAARPAATGDSCVDCHAAQKKNHLSAPVAATASSAHGRIQGGCTACHGGDPSDRTTRAHERRQGFRGRPKPGDIAQLCARCHTDPERSSDSTFIPAEKIARWLGGAHNKALAAGERVPTCISCHGSHAIRRGDDPRIPMVGVGCSWPSCHGEIKPPAPPGGRPHKECTSCHDPHDAGFEEAKTACKKCHGIAHRTMRRLYGFEEHMRCSSCHNGHDVKQTTGACAKCHQKQIDLLATGKGKHENCSDCHQPHKREEGSRASYWKPCSGCHKRIGGAMPDETGTKTHSSCSACHKRHVFNKPSCHDCHPSVRDQLLHRIVEHQQCSRCHPHNKQKPTRDTCTTCHPQRKTHFAKAKRCYACHPFTTKRLKVPQRIAEDHDELYPIDLYSNL